MPTPPTILNKVKLLLKLATSPNPHEADSARKLAEGLIEKHNITPEELETIKDPKPLYGDDEKLFVTIGLVPWRQRLALAVGNHFECQIVQEELVPAEGASHFHYFVFGDPADVKKVQYSFPLFAKEVELLITTRCLGHGPVYTDSYTEGVVDAIKQNILLFGIDIPDKLKMQVKATVEKAITLGGDQIVKEKPKPAEKRVDVNNQDRVKDIMAYFKGIEDGGNIFLDELLEMTENGLEVKELKDET
jgi:hypothetical protein